jgi:hypothetical protein
MGRMVATMDELRNKKINLEDLGQLQLTLFGKDRSKVQRVVRQMSFWKKESFRGKLPQGPQLQIVSTHNYDTALEDFFFKQDEEFKENLRHALAKLSTRCADIDFNHIVKKNSTGKKARKLAELIATKRRLKILIPEITTTLDWTQFQELKQLAKRLEELLKFFYAKQKHFLKRLRATPVKSITRDKRRWLLQAGSPVCKHLPNTSDSEDYARFTELANSKPDLSMSQSENKCIKLNYCSVRSIPLWNLRKTG